MSRPLALLVALLLAAPAAAPLETLYPAATLRGFPELSDLAGHKLADGKLVQWIDHGQLHVRAEWDFSGGRHVEETAVLRQEPQLEQVSWSFEDRQGSEVTRRFDVDFVLGRAAGRKVSPDGKREGWSEKVEIKPGHTFAGLGFAYAAMNLLPQLKAGKELDLEAVVFMPKPRTAGVRLSVASGQTLRRAGRSLPVDLVKIHPKVPWPINKLVGARDILLTYYRDAPPQLLRAEMPLCEVKDPMVRLDVMPGGTRLPRAAARSRR
jgi:hypothetical protein